MINLIINFIVVISIHELTHYYFAKIFKRKPQIKLKFFIFPYTEYEYSNKYLENCIISISPVLIHTIFILFGNSTLRLINLIFMLIILPVTSDGLIFWSNFIKYLKKRR